jgi:hypothetical protein
MRYRLRTLLIAMGLLPPTLAGVWFLTQEFPWVLPIAFCFAVFWLMCGVVWLMIMRCLERYLEEKHD